MKNLMRGNFSRMRKSNLISQLFSVLLVFVFGCVVTSCDDDDENEGKKNSIVYIQSNSPEAGKNSILAYEIMQDGSLTPLAGSPFLTGGTGLGNPKQVLGPNDLDVPMIIQNDLIYSVNSGSHTIAVHRIGADGSLTPISGSPFPSGGENPVSLDIRDGKLFVVNKSQDPINGNSTPPSYNVFMIDENGGLVDELDSFEVTEGSSPSYAYIPDNSDIMFGSDFLGFMAMPPVGTLRSFQIATDGSLQPVPETPQSLPVMGGALGLLKHPKENILYVGFPVTAEIGVYNFDSDGQLTFNNKVAAGKAACWIRSNSAGTRMYTLNSAEATVSVHDITDAESPKDVQKFTLKLPGPLFATPDGMMVVSSQPFHIELYDDRRAFVVSQRANPSDSYQEGNFLHSLAIDSNGEASEDSEPMSLPVPYTARPQGIVFYKR